MPVTPWISRSKTDFLYLTLMCQVFLEVISFDLAKHTYINIYKTTRNRLFHFLSLCFRTSFQTMSGCLASSSRNMNAVLWLLTGTSRFYDHHVWVSPGGFFWSFITIFLSYDHQGSRTLFTSAALCKWFLGPHTAQCELKWVRQSVKQKHNNLTLLVNE